MPSLDESHICIRNYITYAKARYVLNFHEERNLKNLLLKQLFLQMPYLLISFNSKKSLQQSNIFFYFR